ncbi:ABC transporter substrate-binding protein [Planomonospora venezuelensis]|uniref:Glycine betaine/proline transport system substrate-binding protein n=1 Tax=Planomonospora venezuelensis TaxID=1999 RepID=A0A841DEX9_PLAVE|nr:ABC transporter substrate-binding protein [Planomonospora venezuelensis]MBB5965826.1 glycine betaine/proline transport system substrate-binding protein [Planomonospora venezuelensis]GIN04020.1 glycine/betaine-binding protein [Planomonospora venezuelensis]
MRRGTTFAAGLAALLLLTSCGGQEPAPERTGGTVRIAVNPWVGYEASAAVLGALLEKELGYEVETVKLNEAQSWEGLEKGTVDVIVENWGREAEKKTYIEEKKVAVSAGRNGNKGIIGWYVPQWMVEKYPDITDWRNLNKYAHLFRTSKSGDSGQLLDGDPSYVTNDEALVRNLGLDYKVVYSGGEDALIKAAIRATERREPLLMYFYEPQWLFTRLKLVKINLPPYAIGCDADAKKVACDYPPYLLDKIVSRRFADTGGRAYELVRNFAWTNDQQNAVAGGIADDGLSAQEAAAEWIEANEIVWKDWVPR